MANTISQDGRPLRLKSKVAGDDLVLRAFSGEEAMSRPFSFELDMVSMNAAIDGQKMIGTQVTVTIAIPSGGERVISGLISRFVAGGRDAEGLAAYRGELVPALWFLSLRSQNRIFQNMSVPAIVEKVVGVSPGGNINVSFKNECTAPYPDREYCVQYGETDLSFVSRLLEEEGIFYFFEHTANGHTMVIADTPSKVKPCPVQDTLSMVPSGSGSSSESNSAISFEREDVAVTGNHRTVEWDPFTDSVYNDATGVQGGGGAPRAGGAGGLMTSAGGSLSSAGGGGSAATAIGSNEEYPSRATDQDRAAHYANLRAGVAECQRLKVRGASNCPALQSGKSFDLTDHFRRDANQSYQLTAVSHHAYMPVAVNAGTTSDGFDYGNSFTAIPANLPYRPPLATPRSVIRGSQTAKVVGKSNEEIWVDKYGRVKILFPWDIHNEDPHENSSCWVRVSSAWAGHGFGWIQIPRIGEEVIVDFLEGDPDRPIITGRVYNSTNMPPWGLAANQTRSGLRTRSSKGGTEKNANELYFEDKKGSEQVFLHAEKALVTEVEEDETRTVGHDRTTTIQNADTRTVKEGDDVTTVEKGKQKVEIKIGNQELTLGQGNQTVELGQGNQTITLKMGNQDTKVKLGKIANEAMQKIELKVGQSSIVIDNMGVTIKGMSVKIEGTMQAEVKAVMTKVSGDAMLTAKGGITMIN